ncbi:hypothetical protein TWF730_000178 [Orbilia blumenaviensis]|uniref:Uncharacterized protein n=1 Tax=Orbilia blumenaviensis TaxID=1796055 RepID=A0AAV9VMU2_9PEZI
MRIAWVLVSCLALVSGLPVRKPPWSAAPTPAATTVSKMTIHESISGTLSTSATTTAAAASAVATSTHQGTLEPRSPFFGFPFRYYWPGSSRVPVIHWSPGRGYYKRSGGIHETTRVVDISKRRRRRSEGSSYISRGNISGGVEIIEGSESVVVGKRGVDAGDKGVVGQTATTAAITTTTTAAAAASGLEDGEAVVVERSDVMITECVNGIPVPMSTTTSRFTIPSKTDTDTDIESPVITTAVEGKEEVIIACTRTSTAAATTTIRTKRVPLGPIQTKITMNQINASITARTVISTMTMTITDTITGTLAVVVRATATPNPSLNGGGAGEQKEVVTATVEYPLVITRIVEVGVTPTPTSDSTSTSVNSSGSDGSDGGDTANPRGRVRKSIIASAITANSTTSTTATTTITTADSDITVPTIPPPRLPPPPPSLQLITFLLAQAPSSKTTTTTSIPPSSSSPSSITEAPSSPSMESLLKGIEIIESLLRPPENAVPVTTTTPCSCPSFTAPNSQAKAEDPPPPPLPSTTPEQLVEPPAEHFKKRQQSKQHPRKSYPPPQKLIPLSHHRRRRSSSSADEDGSITITGENSINRLSSTEAPVNTAGRKINLENFAKCSCELPEHLDKNSNPSENRRPPTLPYYRMKRDSVVDNDPNRGVRSRREHRDPDFWRGGDTDGYGVGKGNDDNSKKSRKMERRWSG